MKYLKVFIFFSVFGFLFEEIFCKILNVDFNSGILNGPYTPIYGIGILIIFYGIDYIRKIFTLKKYQELIIAGGLLFFVITILELIGGILIEAIFNKVFWSYKDLKLNYGNYIAIEISIGWTILGIILYQFKDFFIKIINKIPNFIYYLTTIIIIIDFIYTLLTM